MVEQTQLQGDGAYLGGLHEEAQAKGHVLHAPGLDLKGSPHAVGQRHERELKDWHLPEGTTTARNQHKWRIVSGDNPGENRQRTVRFGQVIARSAESTGAIPTFRIPWPGFF